MAAGKISNVDEMGGQMSYEELVAEKNQLQKELQELKDQQKQLTIELSRKSFNQQSLERRLQNHSIQLVERNKKFKILKNDLEDFYYAASHHLKSPLRNISSFVQLLEKKFNGSLDSDSQQYMKFVTQNTKHLNNLIEDLLYYTMLNSHGEKVQLVAMEEVVTQINEEYEIIFGEQKARLKFEELPVIKAYPFLIHLLFRELVENAIKFKSKRDPVIKISCSYKNGDYTFSVQDNGLGMKEKYAEKVFTLFGRLHEPGKFKGTGMGLALCQKIVELHNGRIWYTSRKGHGTTFNFTLPVAFELIAGMKKQS